MIDLIRKLFDLCDHKWKIIQEVTVEETDDWGDVCGRYTRYHLQCEKCGNVKTRNMK